MPDTARETLHKLLGDLIEFVVSHSCKALQKDETKQLRQMDTEITALCVKIGAFVEDFSLPPEDNCRFLGSCRIPFQMATLLAVSKHDGKRGVMERGRGRVMIVYSHKQWRAAVEQLRATLTREGQ
jgi:hypothetical protein